MSIRYWFPADEELKGLAGVAITDEDAGFVVGTMKCFAGVALAGMVAATALAAQLPYADGYQVDERVAPAALLVDETEYLPPVRPTATWPRAFTADDEVAPQPTIALDEGQWTVTVPAAPALVLAITDDDQYIGTLGFDEEGSWPVPLRVAQASVAAWADDSDGVAPSILVVDSIEWSPSLLATPAPLVRAVLDDESIVPALAVSVVDDDAGLWPARIPLPSRVPGAVTADDEWIAPSVVLVDDDAGRWPRVVAPVAAPLFVARLEEDWTPLPAPIADPETGLIALPTRPSTSACLAALIGPAWTMNEGFASSGTTLPLRPTGIRFAVTRTGVTFQTSSTTGVRFAAQGTGITFAVTRTGVAFAATTTGVRFT